MRYSVRLAMPEDREQMRGLARDAAAEHEPDEPFDDGVYDRMFTEAVTRAHPTCFVVGLGERLVGFVLCEIRQFTFSGSLIAVLEVIYTAPGSRGTRAPALLFGEFLRWGRTVGCVRYKVSADNPATAERTARFFERFGARRVGLSLVL